MLAGMSMPCCTKRFRLPDGLRRRVVIGQRERTIALMPTDGGLVAHTLDEQRDINDAKQIFDDVTEVKTDPEMVQLAKQLIDRQTAKDDPSDIEDRYETRLREMLDAKLKGEGIDLSEPAEPDRTNVVDLMAALKKSLENRRRESQWRKRPPSPQQSRSVRLLPRQRSPLASEPEAMKWKA